MSIVNHQYIRALLQDNQSKVVMDQFIEGLKTLFAHC